MGVKMHSKLQSVPAKGAPVISYGVFHVEGAGCTDRHVLMDALKSSIGNLWIDIGVETVSFPDLQSAEQGAKLLGLNFDHTAHDRKPGATGFMKGEIGLWIGTITALRKFLQSQFDLLILFEDDTIPTEGEIECADTYLKHMSKRVDLFSLFTPEQDFVRYGRKRHPRAFIGKRFYDNPSRPTKLYQDSCTLAYAVSRKGARRILQSVEVEIREPLD